MLPSKLQNTTLKEDASNAVQIAWDMLTLNTPLVPCTPQTYSSAWHEVYGPQWNDRNSKTPLIYFRPLLLHGTLDGSAATKALVGNIRLSSYDTIHFMLGLRTSLPKVFKILADDTSMHTS